MKQKNKIIVILISFLALHCLFMLLFSTLSGKYNELVVRLNNYKSINHKINVLFLGDSHVERSIDPSKIKDSYSLAYYGENNVMCYYRLKYCIDNNLPKPNYIVMPCDIVTFSDGFNNFRTNKFFYYSLIPSGELKNFEKNKMEAYYNYGKVKLFPYSEWQYGLNIYNANRSEKGKKMFSNESTNEKIRNTSNFIQDEMNCRGHASNLFSETALLYLDKTIKLCSENGIKLIFVKFPMTREVFDEVEKNVDSGYLVNRPSERIVEKNNLPILNFEKLFEDRPELFFDCHHLNDNGKLVFMPQFKEKLDSLMTVY